jgi:hypothetical protein
VMPCPNNALFGHKLPFGINCIREFHKSKLLALFSHQLTWHSGNHQHKKDSCHSWKNSSVKI